jgi:hypothetical protein
MLRQGVAGCWLDSGHSGRGQSRMIEVDRARLEFGVRVVFVTTRLLLRREGVARRSLFHT